MADICYEVVTDASPSSVYGSTPPHSRRRQRFQTVMSEDWEKNCKRSKQEDLATRCSSISRSSQDDFSGSKLLKTETVRGNVEVSGESPRYGVSSVCGRRREMEDAVAIHPSFSSRKNSEYPQHYFGVYDGHGCSHVRSRFHATSRFTKFYIFSFSLYEIVCFFLRLQQGVERGFTSWCKKN